MSIIFSFVKSRSLTTVRRILGIKIVKHLETSHHIVRNLVDSFQKIGNKSHSKYCNVARCVLSQSIDNKISFSPSNLSSHEMQYQNP